MTTRSKRPVRAAPDTLRNGELLDAAEAAGFDVFVTTDRNIRHQQNLAGRKLAIVVIGAGRWRLIRKRLPAIAAAVTAAIPQQHLDLAIAPSDRAR
jgi:hypothetical protein